MAVIEQSPRSQDHSTPSPSTPTSPAFFSVDCLSSDSSLMLQSYRSRQRIMLLTPDYMLELQNEQFSPPQANKPQIKKAHDKKAVEDYLPTTPNSFPRNTFYQPSFDSNNYSRMLTTSMVFGISFFLTCGGPSGSEPAISAAGPLFGIVAMLFYPLAFAVPFSYVVAELATAFPDDGGFVLWVKNAFGPFWGFQIGYWEWVSNAFCNALYPITIISSLSSAYGHMGSPVVLYILKAFIAILLSLPTLFSVRFVSYMSLALMVLVLLPYVVLSLWSFNEANHYEYLVQVRYENVTKVNATSLEQTTEKDIYVDWSSLVSTLFWCYDGIYLVSLFGGQVRHPTQTYPRVIFSNLLLATVSYVIVLIAITALGLEHWSDFDENSMTTVAGLMGDGDDMKSLIVFSSVCSNIGLFASGTFSCSYQLNGMAESGLLPRAFANRHEYFQTPHLALLANVLPVLFLLAFDSQVLMDASNAFSAIVEIMIVLAAIKLRISHPSIHRPTKVPGGLAVFVFLMLLPLGVLGFIIYTALQSSACVAIICASTLFGVCYGFVVFWYFPKHSNEIPEFEVARRPNAAFG